MISQTYLHISLPSGKVLKIRDGNILLLVRGHKKTTSHKFYQILGSKLKLIPANTYKEAKKLVECTDLTSPTKITLKAIPSFQEALNAFQGYIENQNLCKTTMKKWNILKAKYLAPIKLELSKCTCNNLYEAILKPLITDHKYSTVEYLVTKLKKIMELAKLKFSKIEVPDISNIQLLYKCPNLNRNRATMHAKDIPYILSRVKCNDTTRALLLLSIHLLLRPVEMTNIKVSDIQGNTLIVPKTKTMRNFRVPLSPQAKKLVDYAVSLKKDTNNPYLFEGRLANTSINSSTINVLLKRAGFKDMQTAHGFRAMGRTWLETNGIKYEVAEMCLSHVVGSRTCRAYIRTDYFEERVEAMNSWSEYVEHIVEGK